MTNVQRTVKLLKNNQRFKYSGTFLNLFKKIYKKGHRTPVQSTVELLQDLALSKCSFSNRRKENLKQKKFLLKCPFGCILNFEMRPYLPK